MSTTLGRVTWREIAFLAIPGTITALLGHAFRPLDQFYVGSLGDTLGRDAQAALGSAIFVSILSYSFFAVISAGTGPLVARATGSGDTELQKRVVGRSLFAAGFIGILLALLGLAGADGIAALVGLEGRSAMLCADYLRVLFGLGIAFAFAPVVDTVFVSMGNTWLPMLLQALNLALNAVFTPFFLFVVGLHTAGAALGSVLAQTLTTTVGAIILVRTLGLRWHHLRPDETILRIVRIGLPVAVSIAAYAGVYWAMLATSITQLGDDVVAGLGIGFGALEAVAWPSFAGASVALSSIVGRRLGAGQPEEAWRVLKMLSGPIFATGVAWGLVFWFFGPSICRWFASSDGTLEQATLYALVLAWSQPFVALEALAEGTLAGAGDTMKVLFGTVPFNLVRVPLAWWLAIGMGWGAVGVWWAINITTFLKVGAKGAMVLHGGWARARI